MVRSASIVAACLACFASASVFADANPTYESWAKHKPGTCITMTGSSEAMGNKTELEQTFTLKEVTPEKAVVELKATMTMMGNKTEMPAQNIDIPAAASAATPTTPDPKAPDSKTTEEKVTVAGKEYDAKCITTHTDVNGMKTTATIWQSPEVPGMTLKMETKSEGQMTMATKMELTKVELK